MQKRRYDGDESRRPAGLLGDRRGATAIEYGLLAAMIAIALVGMSTLTNVAGRMSNTFDQVGTALTP